MSMRISDKIAGAGLICLALAGCDKDGDGAASAFGDSRPERQAVADCAIGPSAQWARNCVVERDGPVITIRHSDGGFRRFEILKDRRGLAAADGAEPTSLAVVGDGQIEVSAGDDRYRLPATISGTATP